jgi:dienelactone hydrolase
MSRNLLFIVIVIITVLILTATFLLTIPSTINVHQPSQPSYGPGGSNYTHEMVKMTVYGEGEKQYWIFEPASPTPKSAPIIVFNHGWGATTPTFYQAWINHLVRQGYIVVYPRYQTDIFTPSDNFTSNSIQATQDSLRVLQNGDHVRPELDRFAIVGHSVGGIITVNLAALSKEKGLPEPKAVFAVEPGKSRTSEDQMGPVLEDLTKIPSNSLLLSLAGDQDNWVGDDDAKRIIRDTPQISSENKDYIFMLSDEHGDPALLANHFAPLAAEFSNPNYKLFLLVDAWDYYGTWKLFDGLLDAAFYNKNRQYALGNTNRQRFMGTWSDGTPVKEPIVTDVP